MEVNSKVDVPFTAVEKDVEAADVPLCWVEEDVEPTDVSVNEKYPSIIANHEMIVQNKCIHIEPPAYPLDNELNYHKNCNTGNLK